MNNEESKVSIQTLINQLETLWLQEGMAQMKEGTSPQADARRSHRITEVRAQIIAAIIPATDVQKVKFALECSWSWLSACLNSPHMKWDGDQHAAATQTVQDITESIAIISKLSN